MEKKSISCKEKDGFLVSWSCVDDRFICYMRQLQKQNNCQYRLEKFSSTAKNDTKGIILEFILILI